MSDVGKRTIEMKKGIGSCFVLVGPRRIVSLAREKGGTASTSMARMRSTNESVDGRASRGLWSRMAVRLAVKIEEASK
jgi:hypothetical protein